MKASADSQPVDVSGIAILASKDLQLLTSSRAKAQWLLTNKHKWTELLFPQLKTFPSRFPILLHAVPTNFKPSNQAHLQELGLQNRINLSLKQSAQWLGNPISTGKKNVLIFLHLLDKDIAAKIESLGIFL